MSYEIKVKIIPDLPLKPYRKGMGNYEGVVAHATAVWEDSDDNQLRYFVRNWRGRSAFAHYFVDNDSITQIANVKFLAWAAGYTANQRYAHVELCQTKDPAKFEQSWKRYTWLLAKLLFDKKLGVVDGETLVSHKFCSDTWKDTSHQDPIEYLKFHNKEWKDVVHSVSWWYKQMEKGDDKDE